MSLWVKEPAPSNQYFARSDWDWYLSQFSYGGIGYQTGTPGMQMLYNPDPVEPIADNFGGYVARGLFGNTIIWTLELIRLSVFAEARFLFQRYRSGRPAELFPDPRLSLLEKPWQPEGTTSKLLRQQILDADFAGNSYHASYDGEIIRLRPDWVEIIYTPRMAPIGPGGNMVPIGYKKLGYFYYHGGRIVNDEPAMFLVDEVAHFAPVPDPLAKFRGRSWITACLTEILTDEQANKHKLKYFENGATPNIAISLKTDDTEKFEKFKEIMRRDHRGVDNAYETLMTAAGADVTVIGSNLKNDDFAAIIGKSETRVANAAGIHPVVAGFSEGMQGSSLNAGNYQAAKRQTVDRTFHSLWRDSADAFSLLVPPPDAGSRLSHDARDIAFLRDDAKDIAEIAATDAQIIRTLGDGGWKPESIISALVNGYDWSSLLSSGLLPVQLQPPGTTAA